jgi:hypothetical protein
LSIANPIATTASDGFRYAQPILQLNHLNPPHSLTATLNPGSEPGTRTFAYLVRPNSNRKELRQSLRTPEGLCLDARILGPGLNLLLFCHAATKTPLRLQSDVDRGRRIHIMAREARARVLGCCNL